MLALAEDMHRKRNCRLKLKALEAATRSEAKEATVSDRIASSFV